MVFNEWFIHIVLVKRTVEKMHLALNTQMDCICTLMMFGVTVFSLGNNAYGQCGRPIVEGEDFRSVYVCH